MASSLNGTGITFSNATTLSSAPVTSVAASGGITGGTITTTGTLSLDTNNVNGIGSTQLFWYTGGTNISVGATVSGSYLFQITAVGTAVAADYGIALQYGISLGNYLPANRTTTFVLGSGATAITYSPMAGTWRATSFGTKSYNACGLYYVACMSAIRTA